MDQNEAAMSEDDDSNWTTESEGETTASEDSEASLLDEIEDAREALASCPLDHPDRAECAAALGYHLLMCYNHTGNISLINEAIEVEREALALRPPGHPNRADSCESLGVLLHVRYQQTGDVMLLDEAIGLNREVLASQPPGHPDQANMRANIGSLLYMRYQQTGDVALLDEAIKLEREALALHPSGHPNRATSCCNLSVSLYVRYMRTGDVALLEEAIELDREALALRLPDHPDRVNNCLNLGSSLYVLYQRTGNVALLDEAIELDREALASRPPGHPDRANSCASLGISLHVRYQETGDAAVLHEAIKFNREALALRPPNHPDRANSCLNLGASLYLRYQWTGDVALLDEAIDLEREALALRPTDHPDRAHSCASLAGSLHIRYERTGDDALLCEAIKLEREALALRPTGHLDRANSCADLGSSLHVRYKQTGDVALLDEAIDAFIYASEHSSSSRAWYSLTQLCQLHLLGDSPHYSVLKALEYLQQSLKHEVGNIHHFISSVCFNATLVWDKSSGWTSHTIVLLGTIYAQIVDQLPLVANFVLNTSSRLQFLKATRQVGSDACVAALLAEQPATAVTLLDRAHGIVWTQALHQRDPQMDGAPKDLAIELEDLLRAIARSPPMDSTRLPDRFQDLRHRQNTRIQAILREIRAMPGLAHFMLGSTYETLRESARDHPVVVLVAARDHAFALIIPTSANADPDLLPLDVAWNHLHSLADTTGKANLRYRARSTGHRRVEASDHEITLAESTDQERAMRNGNFASEWSPLASLWRDVVKPVLTRLHITVSHPRIVPAQC
jgi:tetratricopeptide (TPR) repeat protein